MIDVSRRPNSTSDRSVHSNLPDRSDLPATGARIHMVGIGGAGMRGLSVLLAHAGYRISGCDRGGVSALDEDLGARDVTLFGAHDPAHVDGVQLVIHSSAVSADLPELEAARKAGVPVVKRARALGALLNDGRLVGITGTHGKTTITALAGVACEAAGLDPTVAVGGRVERWEGFARPGEGPVSVVEADEYDRSFLSLDPSLGVVSSLEPEHLDVYGTFDAVREAYLEFGERAARRDGVLWCADDPGAAEIGRALGSELSYGLAEDSTYRVAALGETAGSQRCRLTAPEGSLEFELELPGLHNVQNAAVALAVALRLGGERAALGPSLAGFRGVDRRLQQVASVDGIVVVDDYAHHPTEVRASIGAVRARYPGRPVVAVFQPHLYSRTAAFATAFAEALAAADEAFVLPIYPAREEPIPGVRSEMIVEGASRSTIHTADSSSVSERVAAARGGPERVFLFMGAGDVTDLAREAAAALRTDAVGA